MPCFRLPCDNWLVITLQQVQTGWTSGLTDYTLTAGDQSRAREPGGALSDKLLRSMPVASADSTSILLS